MSLSELRRQRRSLQLEYLTLSGKCGTAANPKSSSLTTQKPETLLTKEEGEESSKRRYFRLTSTG